jgi:glycine/D-amino acid oxidase-like deaminating enzyme
MGAGVVSTQFWDETLRPLGLRSRAIVDERVGLRRCGVAQVALSARSATVLARLRGGRDGLPRALRAAFAPAFRRRIVAARFEPGDGWVVTGSLLRAFRRRTRRVRARFLGVSKGVVETTAGAIAADRVVLALGAGAALPGVALRRAEAVSARLSLPAAFHVLDGGLYARPAGAACVAGDGDAPWEGGDPERCAPSREGTAAIARALERAFGRPVRTTPLSAGVLAFTRSRRPLLSRSGDVWTLTGLGGDGLSLAPALGERVAAEVLAD